MSHSTANGPANGIPRVTPAVLADIFGPMPNAPAPGSEAAALTTLREMTGRLGLDEVLRRLGHDPDAYRDVAPPPPPADDDDDDDDDEPGDWPAKLPLPLARCILTVASPSEPGVLVELEVLVLDEGSDDFARWHGLPESRRPGWAHHSLYNMSIVVRSNVGTHQAGRLN